ncbi:MAG TPA: hypothetical protein GXX29_12120 [Firmicutes bacterium]|nr:hypothetical protein [Bacillota bacterium]
MALNLTSGFFPVAGLPAAQLVKLRVYITNLENRAGRATVEVNKATGFDKERVLLQEIEVPGNEQRFVELGSDQIEGEAAEVIVRLPDGGFLPPDSGMRPGVAIISLFTGDESTSLLQWISAGDFVPIPGTNAGGTNAGS